MTTKIVFTKASPAAGLALLLAVLAIKSMSPPAWAAVPVALTLKGQWPGRARGPALDVAVQGQYAYVAANEGGLIIVDVSDPANLVAVGGFRPSGGSSEPYFRSIAISGDYVYAAEGYAGSGLHVIDVGNPASPRRVGGYDTRGSATDVAVSGGYAYLADEQGLQVIDISDPRNPVRIGGADGFYARAVVVSGKYAYVANNGQWDFANQQYVGMGLRILDVSDPARPVPVGNYETTGLLAGVAVSGNHVYLAEARRWESDGYVGGGWHVLDLRDPAQPVRVAGMGDLNATAVSVEGDYAYVGVASSGWDAATGERIAGSLLVFDVSDPAAPTFKTGRIGRQ